MKTPNTFQSIGTVASSIAAKLKAAREEIKGGLATGQQLARPTKARAETSPLLPANDEAVGNRDNHPTAKGVQPDSGWTVRNPLLPVRPVDRQTLKPRGAPVPLLGSSEISEIDRTADLSGQKAHASQGGNTALKPRALTEEKAPRNEGGRGKPSLGEVRAGVGRAGEISCVAAKPLYGRSGEKYGHGAPLAGFSPVPLVAASRSAWARS